MLSGDKKVQNRITELEELITGLKVKLDTMKFENNNNIKSGDKQEEKEAEEEEEDEKEHQVVEEEKYKFEYQSRKIDARRKSRIKKRQKMSKADFHVGNEVRKQVY